MLDSNDRQTYEISLAVVGGPVAVSAAMVVDHASDGFVLEPYLNRLESFILSSDKIAEVNINRERSGRIIDMWRL